MVPKQARLAALSNFEDSADRIVEAYERRHLTKGPTPYESPLGTFKRESYELLRRTIADEGKHNVIKSIVRRFKIEPARLHYADNPFHYGLLAIDPHRIVTKKRRLSLWSRQMAYANRHDVPAYFLLGFLWQSGSPNDISRKLKEGAREPWFGR